MVLRLSVPLLPICLLEALDCSPSFPVFLTGPHVLCLMDSCSQSCQFQLSLRLRLQNDRTHKSLWKGKDLGGDEGQKAEAAQGAQVLSSLQAQWSGSVVSEALGHSHA